MISRLPSRTRVIAAIGAALLLLLAGIAVIANTTGAERPSAGSERTASPSAEPTPSAAPSHQPEGPATEAADSDGLSASAAEATLAGYISQVDSAAAEPEDGVERLAEVAAGPMLLELELEYQELADNGWTRQGQAKLGDIAVLESDLGADPATATVQACVDSTDVVILDAAGKPLPSAADAGTPRSLNVFTLERDGADWRVTARSFPTDPNC